MSASARPARSCPSIAGFTLIELLVVIAVISVLIGILLPALGRARTTAKGVREISAARQLMIAYTAYADDNAGKLMVGFVPTSIWNDMVARNEQPRNASGVAVGRIPGQRYPWRLAPYFDYQMDALYTDKRVLEELADAPGVNAPSAASGSTPLEYVVSAYPCFGVNGYFFGGGMPGDSIPFSNAGRRLFGDFQAKRIDQPRRSSSLMVFASARSNAEPAFLPGYGTVEGSFVVKPPYNYATSPRAWDDAYSEGTDDPDGNSGRVSLRFGGKGAAAYLDTHAELLGWDAFNDMRLWADQADRADWQIPLIGP